ncbi:MAG: S8 family serine peptidase [Solirubrobacterales bacterium]
MGDPAELVRVRIMLADQPVLRATSRPAFQRVVFPPSATTASGDGAERPDRITVGEKDVGRRNERRYTRGIDALGDDVAKASAQQIPVVVAVRNGGGKVLVRDVIANAIVARLPRGELARLASRRGVQFITPADVDRPLMDVSVPVTGAPSWWAAGFTGGTGGIDSVPADAGIASEVPDSTHPAFAGLAVDRDPALLPVSSSSTHGTHTSGVVASQEIAHRGVAHGTDHLVAGRDTYLLGIPDFDGNPGATDPAEAFNLSFGGDTNDDNSGAPDDLLVDAFNVGYAQGAGNDGPTIGTVGNVGRNVLTIGAFADLGTTSTADDIIASFSSRGPSPGGRKKPDLVAPGLSILSPSGHWENTAPPCDGDFTDPDTSCADFTNVNGTSFSAPHVAGALTLLEGAGISDPKVQRAILINSARDFAGQTSWQPDSGWGALDLTEALAHRTQTAESTVEGGSARFYRSTVGAGDKATLAWELRGIYEQSLAYTVSNLDLRAYRASDLAAIAPPADPGHGGGPDAGDPNDTVEQIRSPAAQETIYKVEASSTVDGANAEPFALAAESSLEQLSAPEVDPVNITGSESSVSCGSEIVVTAAFENSSDDLDAESATASLTFPAGIELVSGPAIQQVSGGTLETSTPASEVRSWTLRPTAHGTHQLSLTGAGGTMGETFNSSDSIAITGVCPPPDPPPPDPPALVTEVVPTTLALTPAAPTRCGVPLRLDATLRNGTSVDAADARAELVLPAGAELVSGGPAQNVSEGVLEAGASEPHTWSLRLREPGSRALTITGTGTASGRSYSAQASLTASCQRRAVDLQLEKLKLKKGKLVVSGELTTADGGVPTGEVEIVAAGKGADPKMTVDADDEFAARLRICRPGKRKVTATYPGDVGYLPASERAAIKLEAKRLRC